MAKGRKGYYAAGGGSSDHGTKISDPYIDKDPFYRTMDIFNGVFKKNIKLRAGAYNKTDLHIIEVNFGELKPSKISQMLREGMDSEHAIFLLECGHEWEGRKITKNGVPKAIGKDYGMCGICGADTIYRGFEHEWQHIIFKSDLASMAIFCEQYASQLILQAPGISKVELVHFIHNVINAFDDIRVNSLWEKVYPGSAMAIWERWRYFVSHMGELLNTSFMAYLFAVAFDIPTNSQNEFEPMRPVIERAMKRVKYRGFGNMLLEVRVVLDRCMGALLANMKPEPPKTMLPPPPPSLTLPPPQPSPGGAGQNQGDGDEGGQPNGEGEQQQGDSNGDDEEDCEKQEQEGNQVKDRDEESHQDQGTAKVQAGQEKAAQASSGGSSGEPQSGSSLGVGGIPSAKDIQASEKERENALSRLMRNPIKLDEKEEHPPPDDKDLAYAQSSQAIRATLNKVLHQDISDLDALSDVPTGEPDFDMQAQIDQLLNGVAQKSESSQLTDGSKAKVTIIEVTTEGCGHAPIELAPGDRAVIQRLRAAFFKSMGKQKAKRSSTGTSIDVEALIQYLGDHQDADVFQNEDINQGFAYSVVCDMSGSMKGSFPIVCQAVEMLKQALDFPFVLGNLWGFRGGEPIGPSTYRYSPGEVWMYRYSPEVNWYTGTTPFRIFPGPSGLFQVPVECGGITPMNSAINIATSHLWRKMPAGMAKRMFLLTDGSPIQTRVTGRSLPESVLRQFVANEIKKARSHGVEVYTLVIGENAIDDERCLQMFGQKKFWNKVGRDRVGTVLLTLILRNFNRYLRRR